MAYFYCNMYYLVWYHFTVNVRNDTRVAIQEYIYSLHVAS